MIEFHSCLNNWKINDPSGGLTLFRKGGLVYPTRNPHLWLRDTSKEPVVPEKGEHNMPGYTTADNFKLTVGSPTRNLLEKTQHEACYCSSLSLN